MVMLILACIVCALICLWTLSIKRHGIPPGPRGLFVVGCLPFIHPTKPFETFMNWKNKYGDIYSFMFGSRPAVVLNNYQLIKEVFNKPDSAGRPNSPAVSIFTGGINSGLVMTDGKVWQDLRRFTLKYLKDSGLGKVEMENIITEEIEEALSHLKEKNGQLVDLSDYFFIPVLNIIWGVISGKRMSHTSKDLLDNIKDMNESIESLMPMFILGFLPEVIFRMVPGFFYNYKAIKKTNQWFVAYSEKIIADHLENLDRDHPRDYIDRFLCEMIKQEGESFNRRNLIYGIHDLFSAGGETTTTTLRFAVLYLLHHPDIQERLFRDISEAAGDGRLPTYSDRKNLPYLEAFISEVQRCANIIPLGLFHQAHNDIQVGKFVIPKGDIVISNLHAVHMDPNYWPNPEEFNPDRFIDVDGKYRSNLDSFIPFSIGKRQCPGESLAKCELFLFVACLIQQVKFCTPVGQSPPPIVPIHGVVEHPPPYLTLIQRR